MINCDNQYPHIKMTNTTPVCPGAPKKAPKPNPQAPNLNPPCRRCIIFFDETPPTTSPTTPNKPIRRVTCPGAPRKRCL